MKAVLDDENCSSVIDLLYFLMMVKSKGTKRNWKMKYIKIYKNDNVNDENKNEKENWASVLSLKMS